MPICCAKERSGGTQGRPWLYADLKEKRVVEYDQGFETLKKFNLDAFIECSAKTGENVEIIFNTLTRIMMEKAGLMESEKKH